MLSKDPSPSLGWLYFLCGPYKHLAADPAPDRSVVCTEQHHLHIPGGCRESRALGSPPQPWSSWGGAGAWERTPGQSSSLGCALAHLRSASLLSVRVCPCQRSTRSDRDICESRAPLRRSAADERAGMRDSGAAAHTVRTCGDGARTGTLHAMSPVTSLKSLLN